MGVSRLQGVFQKRLSGQLEQSGYRLVFSLSRYDHVTPLLCQLHWLKAPERIDYTRLPFLFTNVYIEQHRRTFWWTRPVVGYRRPTLTSFSIVTIAGRSPYTTVNHRRPSFPSLCSSCLEWSTASHNIRSVSVYVLQSSEDSPLLALLSFTVSCRAWAMTMSFLGTLIVYRH